MSTEKELPINAIEKCIHNYSCDGNHVYGLPAQANEQLYALLSENERLRGELQTAEEKIIVKYTEWLFKHGYCDDDAIYERPTAAEQFLSEESNEKAK